MWLETLYQGYIKFMRNWRIVPNNQDAIICFIKRGYLSTYLQIGSMYPVPATSKAQCQITWDQILWEI